MSAAVGTMTLLRKWRIEHGYTLSELAGLTGMSASMLNRVERGERRLARHTKVLVSRRLDVAVGDLFEVDEVHEAALT